MIVPLVVAFIRFEPPTIFYKYVLYQNMVLWDNKNKQKWKYKNFLCVKIVLSIFLYTLTFHRMYHHGGLLDI